MSTDAPPSTHDVRTKGQVWTPAWVAGAMASYLAPRLHRGQLLDPAVGPGALVAACHSLEPNISGITAFEIDPLVLSDAAVPGLDEFPKSCFTDLRMEDFIAASSVGSFDAVIANPPYLRHHRLDPAMKDACQQIARDVIGMTIDRRAGVQVFFLLKALSLLNEGGRLAFIIPADVVEGVFASSLWQGIAQRYAVRGILTFDGDKVVFPGVDTNALIVFIERAKPIKTYSRLRWHGQPDASFVKAVSTWTKTGRASLALTVEKRNIFDSIKHGLTRQGHNANAEGRPFTDFARAMRGIASGGNEFFCFTSERIAEEGLDPSLFVRCIGRVRDLSGEVVNSQLLDDLDRSGRPTYLLNLTRESVITPELDRYLARGRALGVPDRALVRQRGVWFAMERRVPPPVLFTYLGRRSTRFVANEAGVVPLTGFLCVYPNDEVDVGKLLAALNHPDTAKHLAEVGKSYGSGAIKVEPGAMRRLVIPESAIGAAELV